MRDSGVFEVANVPVVEQPVAAPTPPPVEEEDISVVGQVKTAFARQNRLAAVIGAAAGAIVPIGIFSVAHLEVDWQASLWEQPKMLLVLFGLLYSAKTVYQWGHQAFDDKAKAVGFVVLLEGMMVCSSLRWLAAIALVYLSLINGIASGCQLTKKKVAKPSWV